MGGRLASFGGLFIAPTFVYSIPTTSAIRLILFGVSIMNRQQRTAITNPCEFAEQCSNPIYRCLYSKGPYQVSVILTLNVGEE